ncbi:unnamed protein product [Rotaria magnacalcarata]|uniref:Mos1 transposase HTH domain-containing protein n=1 Tax=Rotaria magnacalcarata TaxID=392030 RepID=A0A819SBA9_9BILA|nr:unnamed protein product [Rotaria magnacalcarata]
MNNFEIRVLLRHYWKKGLSARAAAAEIREVESEGTIGKTAAIKWFKRFEDGDLDFKDKPRSGRPSILDEGICGHNYNNNDWKLSLNSFYHYLNTAILNMHNKRLADCYVKGLDVCDRDLTPYNPGRCGHLQKLLQQYEEKNLKSY